MSEIHEILQEKCLILRLFETAKNLPNLLREAERKNWTYHEVIHEFLNYELQRRAAQKIEKLMKWAEFPEKMTFENYRLDEETAIEKKQINVLKKKTSLE